MYAWDFVLNSKIEEWKGVRNEFTKGRDMQPWPHLSMEDWTGSEENTCRWAALMASRTCSCRPGWDWGHHGGFGPGSAPLSPKQLSLLLVLWVVLLKRHLCGLYGCFSCGGKPCPSHTFGGGQRPHDGCKAWFWAGWKPFGFPRANRVHWSSHFRTLFGKVITAPQKSFGTGTILT